MNTTSPSVDRGVNARVTEKLLFLYESVTEHTHLEKLIALVGELLRDDQDAFLALPKLERHSQSALQVVNAQLEARLGVDQTAEEAYTTIHFAPDCSDFVAQIEAETKGWFHADGITRIGKWLSGSEEFLIVRTEHATAENAICFLQRLQGATRTVGVRIWHDDYRISAAVETLLRECIQVTESEILVLRQLGTGGRVSDIAQALGKSVETVRSQIKSLSNKLGVSSQMRIIAEVRKLEKAYAKAQTQPRTDRLSEHQFMTSDGRQIEYSCYGPEESNPVLFFHCCTLGRHLPASIETQLIAKGFKIISPSRAGYGRSSMRSTPPADVLTASAKDYAELIRHLNQGRCHLLAHGTGFAHAFRFALLYPELARRMIVLDGVPPAANDEDVDQFKGLFRDMVAAMRGAPHTFELLTNLALLRLSSFADPEKQIRRHFLYPHVDLEAHETPAGLVANTLNVRDLMRNRLKPSFDDALAYKDDWSKVGTGSNITPAMSFIQTRDNPFVTEHATRAFADLFDARVLAGVDTLPLMSAQLDLIISELTRP